MLIIECPYCGPRDQSEFSNGGEAHVKRPDGSQNISDREWAEYVFIRSNPKGLYYERWVHSHGCRKWFNCVRDTSTDEIYKTYKIDEPRPDLKKFKNKVGVVASGHTGVLAETAGVRLPLQSKPLQALVSEPIKPIIDTVVMSSAVHAYVSQSDKGELVIGAGTDSYNSFTQRGGFDVIEDTIRAMVELYPVFGKMKMLRQWGGIVDICPDASPIISLSLIHI